MNLKPYTSIQHSTPITLIPKPYPNLRSPLNGIVDITRLGLFGHSSGGGAAARAAIDFKRTGAGVHLKALAGLGEA
jgi:hypothetical protein